MPILPNAELAALLGACRGKNFRDRRDEAVIRLLIDCGLRVSEVTGIDVEDLDLDGESVQVTGKGSRVRPAYFGAKTGLALDRYLRERARHRHSANPALFLGERGRFTPDGVRERLKVRAAIRRDGPQWCTRTDSGTPTPTTSYSPGVRNAT